MHTLKKFIPYYSPYKAVFVLDLICAAMISLIDLAYPQILRTMTKTVFARKVISNFASFAANWCRNAYHVYRSGVVQILCQLSGAYDGCQYGTGYAPTTF